VNNSIQFNSNNPRYVGGVYGGNTKPTPFLCLVLKMLQIQPEKDIVIEFIKNEDFKYVRALGAYYLRLTGTSIDCYKYLEPLLNDYRKIRTQKRDGNFELSHMDVFIDQLLHEERVCDVQCPRIQKRQILEETNDLEPRVSLLEGDILAEAESSEEEAEPEEAEPEEEEPPKKRERRERSRSREAARPRGRSRSREKREASPRRRRSGSREARRGGSQERRRGSGRERSPEERSGRDKGRREKGRRSRSKERPGESRAERDRREGKGGGGGGGGKDEISVEETNRLRAELGLKPLKGV
jgi:pre-mRNA-splicing factor 38A